MMFDVGITLGYTEAGKEKNRFIRVHDSRLQEEVRRLKQNGICIFSMRILRRIQEEEVRENGEVRQQYDVIDPIDDRIMLDAQGY